MNPKRPDRDDLSEDDRDALLKDNDEPITGPSDSSDSAADSIGLGREDDTSDRNGTGERGTVGTLIDTREASDISADRVIDADEAGLGGGLDQAEEARLGITDEEIAELEETDED